MLSLAPLVPCGHALQRPAVANDAISGARVLVVEDDMMISMLLEDMLTSLGFDVVGSVVSVQEALQVIEATAVIDVAVLDVNLDGTRSDAVADALAARGVPFVFATGYGAHGRSDSHRDRPVLQKPFSRKSLAAMLQRLLAVSSQATG